MRPEIAAFRELETLVRNLGDQLAGYRRRALAAEARARELEQQAVFAESERERLLAAVAEAKRAVTEAEARAAAATRPPTPALKVAPSALAKRTTFELEQREPADGSAPLVLDPRVAELEKENQELRTVIEQARERTTAVVERVRFLRQQMTVDK